MFEAYSVAIRLRLIDSVSSGLSLMAGQFRGLNTHVTASERNLASLEGRLKRIKTIGLVGGIASGIGFAGLSLFKQPLEEAKQWAQETARFASLGFGDKVNKDAEKFALGMKTYGTSARDNLTLVSDAMAVFKDLGHAEMAAPILAKMKFANEAVFGQAAGGNERKFMDMLKVIEFRGGLSSPKEFETQANFVQKVIAGSRGRVDATQLLQALKTGGVGLSRLNNEAFYLGSEPLIQEFGGQRFGTAVMSIYQNLVQARGTVTAQQELYRLGLLNPAMVKFNQLGQLKKALPGAFRGSEVLESEGPLALLNKVLLPAFKAKGVTTDEAIIRELGMILGNRTGSGLMSRIFQQRATIEMQATANRSAQDITGLTATAKKTPAGQLIELHKKWADVMRELGNAVLPIAIRAVVGLTGVVKGVLGFAREFPTLTKGIVIFGASLMTLIAAGGVLTLATAGFRAIGLALAVGKGVSLGAQLLNVADGFGAVASRLGKLGVLAGVGAGAYAATRYLADSGISKALGFFGFDNAAKKFDSFSFGGSLHELINGGYDPNAGSRFVASGKGRGGGKPTQVNLNVDGRKIASVMFDPMANLLSAPLGGANFDGTLNLAPVSLNQGH
jgi:hypothetical protein